MEEELLNVAREPLGRRITVFPEEAGLCNGRDGGREECRVTKFGEVDLGVEINGRGKYPPPSGNWDETRKPVCGVWDQYENKTDGKSLHLIQFQEIGHHFSAAKLAAVKPNVGRMRWLGCVHT